MTQGFVSFGMRTTLLIFILGLFALNSRGQEIQLAADLNTRLYDNRPSYPRDFFSAGEKVYFTASNTDYSRGLYVTDGTEAGTIRLMDLPYRVLGGKVNEMISFKGKVYFTVVTDDNDWLLYSSDGTVAGTYRFEGTKNNPKIYGLYEFNDELYFVGTAGIGKTDGTYSGTQWLKIAKNVNHFCALNGKLYFSGLVPDTGQAFADRDYEIWETDGTTSGSKVVSNINPGGLSFINKIVAHKGQLIAQVSTGSPNFLMKHSGAATSTYDIDSTSRSIQVVAIANDVLYIKVQRPDKMYDLLRLTDDLTDIEFLMSGANFGPYSEQNGTLLFGSTDSLHGYEFWQTDGTQNGTHFFIDLTPGPDGSIYNHVSSPWVKFNGRTYFTQTNTNHIWSTDGTISGTSRLSDTIEAGNLTSYNRGLIFSGSSRYASEPWVSDGTEAGTHEITNLAGEYIYGSSTPNNLKNIEGKLYFTASGNTGNHLYRMDPQTLKLEVLTTDDISGISEYVVTDKYFFLRANRKDISQQILIINRSNGDTAWSNIEPLWGFKPQNLTKFGDKVLFTASDTITGVEIYIADGDTKQFKLLADLDDTTDLPNFRIGGTPFGYTVVGNRCVFIGQTSQSTRYLWSTDGTNSGTIKLRKIGSSRMIKVGEFVYFTNSFDNRIYRTDGSVENTTLFLDYDSSTPYLTVVDGKGLIHLQGQQSRIYGINPGAEHPILLYNSDTIMSFVMRVGNTLLMTTLNSIGGNYLHTYSILTGARNILEKNSEYPPYYKGTLDGDIFFELRHSTGYQFYKYSEKHNRISLIANPAQYQNFTPGVEMGNRFFFRASSVKYGAELFFIQSKLNYDKEGIALFPNPTENVLHIRFRDWDQSIAQEVQILDINGRPIQKQKLTDDHITLNTTELSSGIYILYVKGIGSKKFVKY